MGGLEQHYSADGIENRILDALRAAGLDPGGLVPIEELRALDQFHTGGRRATLQLLEKATIGANQRVLDVGAGLGGPARMIASTLGCQVTCVEMSPDYCAGARLLNTLTGLDHRVEVHRGSALAMPFPEASFEVVWMQNVGMSIAGKRHLYWEIRRVLTPGGRFIFQEVAAGTTGPPHFPVPWATDPADSHLVPVASFSPAVEECGFTAEAFEDISEAELARAPVAPPTGPLNLGVYVDNIAEKARNSRRNLEEGRTRLVRGIFRAT